MDRFEAQSLEHKAHDLKEAGLIDYEQYDMIRNRINRRLGADHD